MQTKMSESAAPSGSSRCASEVDVFSDKPHVEQQDYTLAAQQQLKQTAIKEQSDAKPPPQDEWLRGMLALLLHCTFISYSYSFTSGLYLFFNYLN